MRRPRSAHTGGAAARPLRGAAAELSRDSRLAGLRQFRAAYSRCDIVTTNVLVDGGGGGDGEEEEEEEEEAAEDELAGGGMVFVTEREFRCTNRESGARGLDHDLAFGEALRLAPAAADGRSGGGGEAADGGDRGDRGDAAARLRIRYCRVYFDPLRGSSQEPSKSTGAVHGWDLAHVISVRAPRRAPARRGGRGDGVGERERAAGGGDARSSS